MWERTDDHVTHVSQSSWTAKIGSRAYFEFYWCFWFKEFRRTESTFSKFLCEAMRSSTSEYFNLSLTDEAEPIFCPCRPYDLDDSSWHQANASALYAEKRKANNPPICKEEICGRGKHTIGLSSWFAFVFMLSVTFIFSFIDINNLSGDDGGIDGFSSLPIARRRWRDPNDSEWERGGFKQALKTTVGTATKRGGRHDDCPGGTDVSDGSDGYERQTTPFARNGDPLAMELPTTWACRGSQL